MARGKGKKIQGGVPNKIHKGGIKSGKNKGHKHKASAYTG